MPRFKVGDTVFVRPSLWGIEGKPYQGSITGVRKERFGIQEYFVRADKTGVVRCHFDSELELLTLKGQLKNMEKSDGV